MMIYTPFKWYWIVGGDETQVYSSATGAFVFATDPAYEAWVASGGVATRIGSVDELAGVLVPYRLRPTDPDVLDAYQKAMAETTEAVVLAIGLDHENRIRKLEASVPIAEKQFFVEIAKLL